MDARFLLVGLCFAGLACGTSHPGPDAESGIMDASDAMDSSVDAPPEAADAVDEGDSAPDAMDAPPDVPDWTGPGCADDGIECDGNWDGLCTGCAPTDCCAPQSGEFTCAPRAEDGACPSADLWVDEERLAQSLETVWRYFPPDDCAISEGCVAAEGWRRLLRFATWTPNTGTADMFLGTPSGANPHFVHSECHGHYHFETYADYELLDSDGAVAATGHKQAFCLLDFYRYPGEDDTGAVYSCDYQGIQRGWQDVYDKSLDCQWVDVTDVAPGDYSLDVQLNPSHILLESNYDNNRVTVPVTIAEDVDPDVTVPCEHATTGLDRVCGFTRLEPRTCTPAETVSLGCSSTCGFGSCTGDPILRVCGTGFDPTCTARHALASNDDSHCSDGDLCSSVSFVCPKDGTYVVFHGAYDSSDLTTTCDLATPPAPPPPP